MAVQFFAVYSDIGAGYRGTKKGVEKLAKHCQTTHNAQVVSIVNNAKVPPLYDFHRRISAKYIDFLTPFFKDSLTPILTRELTACQKNGKLPIIISGDHSNAMGNVASFINANADKKIGVVWIDAHADLHSVYTTPSGNMHGMPVATVIGEDNLDCQIGQADPETIAQWNDLKNLAKNLAPTDIHFLGVRDTEQPEEYLIEKYGIFCHSTAEHRQLGFDKILDDLIQKLEKYDTIYVSFDIDSLDKSLVPATGTPVDNGYTVSEMSLIFNKILSLPNVGLFEITEFNPTLDNAKPTYDNVVQLLDKAIGILQQK